MPARKPSAKLVRLFRIAIDRQLPQALKDARDGAVAYAKSDALPHLHAAFEAETYFTADGKKAALGAVSPRHQKYKEEHGYDERLGHMTRELARAIGHEKGLKTFGGRKRDYGFSYDFTRALGRADRPRAEGYAATKAPGLGMFSAEDVEAMKKVAIQKFVDRMQLIIRSSGFPGSRVVVRKRR